MMRFSVFTPVYNEEGNIIPLYDKISKVMNKLGKWELVFVNDGSTDNSLKEMKSIKSKKVRIINLQKNYGQAIAMDAGFRNCRGEYIISLDADLQNDPGDIPRLFEKLQKKKLDVVAGWRYKRKDPGWMIFVTTVAKILRGLFASDGVHDSGCTLRIYKKEAISNIQLWGEMHRYIMALIRWQGYRVGELKVKHHARVHGSTKYNWKKSFKGFVDLIYIWFWKKFSGRPVHLFGITGVFMCGLGMISFMWTAYLKIFMGTSLSDSAWLLLSAFLAMLGFQFFTSGIMLDLLIKSYYNIGPEKRYKFEELN